MRIWEWRNQTRRTRHTNSSASFRFFVFARKRRRSIWWWRMSTDSSIFMIQWCDGWCWWMMDKVTCVVCDIAKSLALLCCSRSGSISVLYWIVRVALCFCFHALFMFWLEWAFLAFRSIEDEQVVEMLQIEFQLLKFQIVHILLIIQIKNWKITIFLTSFCFFLKFRKVTTKKGKKKKKNGKKWKQNNTNHKNTQLWILKSQSRRNTWQAYLYHWMHAILQRAHWSAHWRRASPTTLTFGIRWKAADIGVCTWTTAFPSLWLPSRSPPPRRNSTFLRRFCATNSPSSAIPASFRWKSRVARVCCTMLKMWSAPIKCQWAPLRLQRPRCARSRSRPHSNLVRVALEAMTKKQQQQLWRL